MKKKIYKTHENKNSHIVEMKLYHMSNMTSYKKCKYCFSAQKYITIHRWGLWTLTLSVILPSELQHTMHNSCLYQTPLWKKKKDIPYIQNTLPQALQYQCFEWKIYNLAPNLICVSYILSISGQNRLNIPWDSTVDKNVCTHHTYIIMSWVAVACEWHMVSLLLHSYSARQHFSATCIVCLRPITHIFAIHCHTIKKKSVDSIKVCIKTVRNEPQRGGVHCIEVFHHLHISICFTHSYAIARWLKGIKNYLSKCDDMRQPLIYI